MFIEEEIILLNFSVIEQRLKALENKEYKDISLIPLLFMEVASRIATLELLNIIQEEQSKEYKKRLQNILKLYITDDAKEGVIND